jgi:hypothetical protein
MPKSASAALEAVAEKHGRPFTAVHVHCAWNKRFQPLTHTKELYSNPYSAAGQTMIARILYPTYVSLELCRAHQQPNPPLRPPQRQHDPSNTTVETGRHLKHVAPALALFTVAASSIEVELANQHPPGAPGTHMKRQLRFLLSKHRNDSDDAKILQ